MSLNPLSETSAIHAIRSIAAAEGPAVLAIITGVEGPSYRPVGAMMAIFPEGRLAGSLSSGCVEADIALHAEAALAAGQPQLVRYGKGSPFKDITLPCGGGLDILLVPNPDAAVLESICATHAARKPTGFLVDRETGEIAETPVETTGWQAAQFGIRIDPELAFHVFGKGPETNAFGALARAAGFEVIVFSPDDETLDAAKLAGCDTIGLTGPKFPNDVRPDAYTAVLLFFHDHEWEPPILQTALTHAAFYIGAQGSAQARAVRNAELTVLGVPPEAIARIKGPIGLVPSARDARSLAVGVLAEVLAHRPV